MPLSLRAPSGNTCPDEAGIESEIDKTADTRHAFNSSLSSFKCLATVPELRMGMVPLDRFFSTSAVKSAGLASVGCRVKTAT
jgi:hypothetical protein